MSTAQEHLQQEVQPQILQAHQQPSQAQTIQTDRNAAQINVHMQFQQQPVAPAMTFWNQPQLPQPSELAPLQAPLLSPIVAKAFQLPLGSDWNQQYGFNMHGMYQYPMQQSEPMIASQSKPQSIQDDRSKSIVADEESEQPESKQEDVQQQPQAQLQQSQHTAQGFVQYPGGYAQLTTNGAFPMGVMMGGIPSYDGTYQFPQAYFGGHPYPPQVYPPNSFVDYAMAVRGKRSLDSSNQTSQEQVVDRGSSAQAVKRQRLVWTADLHARFVKAVNKFGADKAMPKQILQMMNIDGLTRENIASHLQKYRLQLKKQEDQHELKQSKNVAVDTKYEYDLSKGISRGDRKRSRTAALHSYSPLQPNAS